MNAINWINQSKTLKDADYGIGTDLASELHGKVIVDKFLLDLFAARLYHADADLYAAFIEAFPDAQPQVFVGVDAE